MKTGPIVVGLAGLVVVVGIGFAFFHNLGEPTPENSPVSAKPENSAGVVHVDDLAAKPEDFQGELVLRAVVAGTNEAEGVFSVIDSREFQSCGVLTCATNYIPVEFSEDLPQPKAVVRITGRVVQSDKGLVFEAKRVEMVQ